MHTLVQLSDLHLSPQASPAQNDLYDALISALRDRFVAVGLRADLLVLTGDIFDSARVDVGQATRAFRSLHERICEAIGVAVPTVIVPGNHDRRRRGFVGPHDGRLFAALRSAMGTRAFVHGCDTPFLAAVVPREYHKLPLSLIAYDSTHLPRGLLSAGGAVRSEDLLQAASLLENEPRDEPVLVLMHHHLVPTPLTDIGSIELDSATSMLRWVVRKVLPSIIANADREELTMTALGSGTALSTLHELGRAVLVLHGHKHYATARMLRGMIENQGDVLIVSAGSAGVAEPWHPTAMSDAAKLWPSFNVVELADGELSVETLSFGYKGRSKGKFGRRKLVRARQLNEAWRVSPVPLDPVAAVGPRLARNHSHCRVHPSSQRDRLDYECLREVVPHGASPRQYGETVEGIPGASLVASGAGASVRVAPVRIELELGQSTSYRLTGGLCRTLAESERVYGASSSPYEWLGLMSRYACDDVRLTVEGLGDLGEQAFASSTDLGTGIEQPLRLERAEGKLVASVHNCAARTLLRIYFPLAR